MPTILNNSCINRVPKVKKVKFSSNDLTGMVSTPYNLLTLKDGSLSRTPFFAVLFSDDQNDYTGALEVHTPYGNFSYISSYNNSEDFCLRLDAVYGVDDNILICSTSPDFNVGVNRPDVELHLYYFEESVSVPFDFYDNE